MANYVLVSLVFTFFLSVVSSFTDAAQHNYDFGHFSQPQMIFENPAALSHCASQVSLSLSNISTSFVAYSENANLEVDQLGTKGLLNAGSCIVLGERFTGAFSIDINALTFNFETEEEAKSRLYPYIQNSSPLGAFGGAFRMTDRISLGATLQMIAKANLDFEQGLLLNESTRNSPRLFSDLDVVIRPSYFFATGLSYELNDAFGFNSLIFYLSWRDKQESEFTFDLDLDLLVQVFGLNIPLELEALAVKGKIDSIPEKIVIGGYGTYGKMNLDFSLSKENWSGIDHPFFNLSLPIDALAPFDELLFPDAENLKLNDTYNVNLLLNYRLNQAISVLAGYGYRGDAVSGESQNVALLGSAMHVLKGGLAYHFRLNKRPAKVSGYTVYGKLNDTDFGSNEQLKGKYLLFQAAIHIFF